MKPQSDTENTAGGGCSSHDLLGDFLQANGASGRLIARLSHAHVTKNEPKPYIADLTKMTVEEFRATWTPDDLRRRVRGFGKMVQNELRDILDRTAKRCPCCGQILPPNESSAGTAPEGEANYLPRP